MNHKAWLLLLLTSCATPHATPAAPTTASAGEPSREDALAEAARLYVEIDQRFEQGDYAGALPLARKCLASRERWLPARHTDVADALDSLGLALELVGQLREARPYYERVVAMRVELLGEDSDPVADGLKRLGILDFELDDPKAALPSLLRARAILERLHGAASKQVTSVIVDLGAVQWAQGDLAAARTSFETGLARAERHDTKAYSSVLENLGQVLLEQGEITRARQVMEEALALRERLLGADHPDVAYTLNGLGELLNELGELGAAKAVLERSLALRERALGPDHPLVATSLVNLARVRWTEGDFTTARKMLDRALAIDEAVHGAGSAASTATLANRAGLEERVGNLETASALYARAEAIIAKTGEPDGREALWLALLASDVEVKLGHRAKARAMLERVLAGAQKMGARGALMTDAQARLGRLLFQDGQGERGMHLVNEAVASLERSSPADSPALADLRARLAMYEHAAGQPQQAHARLSAAVNAITHWLDRSVDAVHDHREAEFVGMHQQYLGDVVAAGWSAEDTWREVLRFQGAAALVSSSRRLETWAREDKATAVAALLHDLAAVRMAIARLQRGGGDKQARELAELSSREAAVTQALTDSSEGFRERARLMAAGPAEICAKLPLHAALLNYTATWSEQLTPTDHAGQLTAFVVRHEGSGCAVHRVDLPASVEEVVKLVRDWRSAAETPATGLTHRRGEALRAAVFDPVASLLDQSLTWVVADGPLAGVSLGVLPEAGSTLGAQRFLFERIAFAYLGSAKDLLRAPPTRAGPVLPPLVIGGLDYGTGPGADAAQGSTALRGTESKACSLGTFPALEGARLEAETVARRLGKHTTMLTGSAGTERSLREQGQHRSILHIATHGFYLETCLREAQQQGRPLEPMDVSGVALAGASQHASRPAEDDGLFTAADFATLDLRGTQLVVLSACDTATGAVVEGQGAQGLQQAVLTAGVPSMVMSLWKVPDEDTRALMDQFYQGVVSGLGPREALQRAQLHALAVQRATGAGDAIGRFGAFIYTGQ